MVISLGSRDMGSICLLYLWIIRRQKALWLVQNVNSVITPRAIVSEELWTGLKWALRTEVIKTEEVLLLPMASIRDQTSQGLLSRGTRVVDKL